jgi:5'-3' exonuclease
MTPDAVRDKYGVPAEHYADFAVLRGDPGDGLPGVAGVGEKTAAALVTRFGSIEDIVAAAESSADGFPAGARARVLAARDYLGKAPGAVRGRLDVPVPALDDALRAEPVDEQRLTRLGTELGIEAPLARLRAAITAAARAQEDDATL